MYITAEKSSLMTWHNDGSLASLHSYIALKCSLYSHEAQIMQFSFFVCFLFFIK